MKSCAASLLILLALVAHGSEVETTREPVPKDGPAISVSGVVVTPAGEPIAGASVFLRAQISGLFYSLGMPHNRDVLARATTGADGRFEFSKIGIPPRLADQIQQLTSGQGGAELVAWSPGRGAAWLPLQKLHAPEQVRLALAPEAPMAGVVKDAAGKPVAGARFIVYGLTRATDHLDPRFAQPGDLGLSLSEAPLGAISGADGTFQIEHLPVGYRVAAVCECDGYRRQPLLVDTGTEPALAEVRYGNGDGPEGVARPLLRSPLALALEPQRQIAVQVVDHLARPVDGGTVQVIDDARRMAGWGGVDPTGRARLSLTKAGRLEFQYYSDPLSPRLQSSIRVEVNPQDPPAELTIRLPKPRWLQGRVLDADTGKPVAGGYLAYFNYEQMPPAEGAQVLNSQAVSDQNGEFRLPVAAGPGTIVFQHAVDGYLAPTISRGAGAKAPQHRIVVPAEGDVPLATLTLSRGLGVRGIVLDEAGKPVSGAEVFGVNVDSGTLRRVKAGAEGKFTLSGLSPYADATILASTDQHVALASIAAAPEHPWDRTRWEDVQLKLIPGVALTGRVLKAGQPLAGVRMKLRRSIGNKEGVLYVWKEAITDENGKYRVAGLVRGDRYWFEIDAPGLMALNWPYQSPYAQSAPEGVTLFELPDAVLTAHRQQLQGAVSDPNGRRVAGVTVSARLASGGMLSRPENGPPPWTKTDAQGRFELLQLPDDPIELMAYIASDQGGVIRFPAKVRPRLNQQDIRIILDPTLTEPIEDLDAPPK